MTTPKVITWIRVWKAFEGWCIQLHSDIGWTNLLQLGEARTEGREFPSLAKATARACAWSRRLGGIPVEVDKGGIPVGVEKE